jgi:uncharacterized membrane protein YobD (UPF0266 family)
MKKIEMTPKRRIDLAYWLGTFQAIITMSFFQAAASEEPLSTPWLIAGAIALILIVYMYIKNSLNFRKETLWMTIKNPAKITIEQEEILTAPLRPVRSPPPTVGPAPRNITWPT